MRTVLDLHVHSKYSRATSTKLDLLELSKWARIKGITILGTGDFTHPTWFAELEQQLVLGDNGLYQLRPELHHSVHLPASVRDRQLYFTPTVEISCIYSKHNKTRRMHVLVVAENLHAASLLNRRLSAIGNVRADGRPILGIDAKELLNIVLDVSEHNLFIPAHVWTPWFAVFGSKSGFDSLEEAFEDLTPNIYAVETGLSSDPAMNWRMNFLDERLIVSFSDAHSGAKLGREATVVRLPDLSYEQLFQLFRKRRSGQIIETIEFYPEEGKYHVDGHRECDVRIDDPKETKRLNNICPKCLRPLTIGVLHRIEDLATHEMGRTSPHARPFRHIVPLPEIIADVRGKGVASKSVQQEFLEIIERSSDEFHLLLDTPESDLESLCGSDVAKGILKVRRGELHISPGFDGVFGKVHLFNDQERAKLHPKQASLL